MKRFLLLAMAILATCCLTGTAFAKHGWGTIGGDSTFAATTIYDLQQFGTASGNSAVTGHPVAGDTLRFTGKILTALDAKPNAFGAWLEEPGAGPWSGVLVYTGVDNPSALGFVVGDIITVQGLMAEFGGAGVTLTEINTGKGVPGGTYPLLFSKTGHTTPPAPKRLVTGSIRVTDPTCAEQWEGVLTELDSVQIVGTLPQPFGRQLLQQIAANTPPACMGAGVDTCSLNPKMINPSPTWTFGQQYRTAVGIISQEFGWYYFAPRNLTDDLLPLGAAPPPHLQRAFAIDATHVVAQFDVELQQAAAQDPTNYDMLHSSVTGAVLSLPDSLKVTLTVNPPMTGGQAESLSVAGIRANRANTLMIGTASAGFRAGITPIVQVQTPGAHHDSTQYIGEIVTVQGVVTAGSNTFGAGAVFIGDPAGGGAPYTGLETFAPPLSVTTGDNVTMAGTAAEFNNKTELTTFYTVINSSGNPMPTLPQLAINQINNGSVTAELYEDMLIATSGTVASDSVVDPARAWFLHTGADTIRVGRNANPNYDFTPHPFDEVDLVAILDYSTSGFDLQPRTTADMHANAGGALGVGNGNLRFSLKQSAPNPFSSRTQIRYSIAQKGAASLRIYNVTGQLVRTLVDGNVAPGTYSASWDGRGENGRSVSSGIYYYRLNSGAQSQTRKLVLSR